MLSSKYSLLFVTYVTAYRLYYTVLLLFDLFSFVANSYMYIPDHVLVLVPVTKAQIYSASVNRVKYYLTGNEKEKRGEREGREVGSEVREGERGGKETT